MKILKKNKNMIHGIHYFCTELKTKIDIIPRGCFNWNMPNSPAAKGGDPKFSDIVFFLLIIYLWGLNKEI